MGATRRASATARARLAIAAAAFALAGCTALVGTRDLYFDADASNGGGEDSGVDGATGPGLDGGPTDDGPIGDTDGGARGPCGVSPCTDTVLAQGLDFPLGVYVDGTNVYVTNLQGGSVVSVPKTGGAVTVVANNQTNAYGITGDGTNIFWANHDFPYDDGGGNKGGVWKCAPGACTPKLVCLGDFAANVQLAPGGLVFAEGNASQVTRVGTDGTGAKSYNTGPGPIAVAADADYVYYERTSYGFLQRQPVAGGATEDYATLDDALTFGLVVLDANNVYYTYTDQNGHGQCVSGGKTLGGPKITYSPPGDLPTQGLAIDDTWVYWAVEDEAAGTDDPTGDGGRVYACKKTGCDGAPILLLEASTGGTIATDASAIYFVESGTESAPSGKVHRLAKR